MATKKSTQSYESWIEEARKELDQEERAQEERAAERASKKCKKTKRASEK